MKVFELNFNLKGFKRKLVKANPGFIDKLIPSYEKVIFESFCFFPKTAVEKQLSDLYFLGEKRSQSPKKALLAEIAERIRNYYFSQAGIKPVDQALRYALFKVNNFLKDAVEQSQFHPKEKFSLDLAVACLSKDNTIYLSKIGNPTILLLSDSEAFDLAENINIACSSSPTFQNIVDGALKAGDKIFISTNNVFNEFLTSNFLPKIASINNQKELKYFLKQNKEDFKQIYGSCLIIFIESPQKPFFLFRPFVKKTKKIKPFSLFSQNNIIKGILSAIVLAGLLFLGYKLFH